MVSIKNSSFWTNVISDLVLLCQSTLDLVMPPSCALCGGNPLGPQTVLDIDTGTNEQRQESDSPGIDAVELSRKTPRKTSHWLCDGCHQTLTSTWPPAVVACKFCAMPRPREPASLHDFACPSCPRTSYPFESVIALGIYQMAMREAVVAAKQSRYSSLAAVLGELLAAKISKQHDVRSFDRVTFVPSHFARRIQRRGPGGVSIMASVVGKEIGVPVEPLVKLTRHVRKQSMLPDADRPGNVRGAFAVKKRYALPRRHSLRDQKILLVDDVLTTGSTASEIASVLIKAGARRVDLAVAARAVRR